MQITLKIDNQDQTFVAPFISGRKLRETMAMSEDMQGQTQGAGMLDKMADYIVDLFGNQFTRDQFYDGIEGDKVISTFTDCVETVTGNLVDKSQQLASVEGKNE